MLTTCRLFDCPSTTAFASYMRSSVHQLYRACFAAYEKISAISSEVSTKSYKSGCFNPQQIFLRFTIVAQTTLGFYLSFGNSLLNEDIKHKGSVFNAPRTPFNYGSLHHIQSLNIQF